MVDISYWLGGRGGQYIMVYYIDPPTNIYERYFDNGVECQLSFICQNICES